MTWYRLDDPEHPAPRDGTVIDVWYAANAPDAGDISTGFRIPNCHYRGVGRGGIETWIDETGTVFEEMYLTHWQPLPEPPEDI